MDSVSGDTKATYKVVNKLLDKDYGTDKLPNGTSDVDTANGLKNFFHGKVHDIYDDIKKNLDSASKHSDDNTLQYRIEGGGTIAFFSLF